MTMDLKMPTKADLVEELVEAKIIIHITEMNYAY